MVGGTPVRGTVTLGAAAGVGGRTITLSSTVPGVVTVPVSVVVPQGSTTAIFTATSTTVTADTGVILGADDGTAQVYNTVTVVPVLASVGLSAGSVQGGQSLSGTVFLNATAPLGGAVVLLESDNGSVTVPVSVTVPAGLTKASFAVNTSAVGANTTVTIRATYSGAIRTTTLTVTP